MSNCFGRDAGSSPFVPIIPIIPIAPALCAVMGKELTCEGFPGTARIVWCTTQPADSHVYMNIVSDTGPWIKVHESLSPLVQCHDVQVPIMAVDSTHYFYVVSETAGGDVLTSLVYIFCTGDEITIKSGGDLTILASVIAHTPVVLEETVGGFTTKINHPGIQAPQIESWTGSAGLVIRNYDKTITETVALGNAGVTSFVVSVIP